MSLDVRNLVRVTNDIRDHVRAMRCRHRAHRLIRSLNHVLDRLERLHKLDRQLAACASRQWASSIQRTAASVDSVLREMAYPLAETRRIAGTRAVRIPSLREVFQDLRQAEEEFGDLVHDRKSRTLSVTTNSIELEGIELGAFSIQLHIPSPHETREGWFYDVVALEPNPEATNSAVTHPHVCDDQLCEGDASAAIHAALAEGRVCDFLQLVNSVLTHYNPGSPYVPLENWVGVACYECGHNMAPDDAHWCHICEHNFCGDCASYCRNCEQTTCLGCIEICPVCDESTCSACLAACPDCGRELCRHCLENGECPCHEENEEDDAPETTTEEGSRTTAEEERPSPRMEDVHGPATVQADAAVHAHGLGQAVVLQGPGTH